MGIIKGWGDLITDCIRGIGREPLRKFFAAYPHDRPFLLSIKNGLIGHGANYKSSRRTMMQGFMAIFLPNQQSFSISCYRKTMNPLCHVGHQQTTSECATLIN